MFSGFKYIQNKDTKEIMISQTEFAMKITEVPMSPARKKMREDPADKAEIHTFRGVSGRKHQLVGWSNTSGCVLSSVSIAADSATTDCGPGLCIKHDGPSSTSACRLGSPDQANACTKHDVAVACRRVVEHWRSCWLAGWLHLWCYRQVIDGKERMLHGPPVPSSLGAEAQAMSVALGFVEWGNIVSTGTDSWTI